MKYLFFVTKPYSFTILEPIQDVVYKLGTGDVAWFTASTAKNQLPPGPQLTSSEEVLKYNPDAILVPGNIVPHFWPGLKVQIFHGLGEEKKGHYRITGFFDLYCTPGPYMTDCFKKLYNKHKNFLIRETGWPKLDPLVATCDQSELKKELGFATDLPLILYAPTFSPKYSSAADLKNEIRHLQARPWQWLIKFHDLMDQSVVREYQKLESPRFKVTCADNIIPLMLAADLMLSDTSSVTYEFLLLDRPLITYQAAVRLDKGINLTQPEQLEAAIGNSLDNPMSFAEQRRHYLKELHPYSDGQSAQRVVEAIDWALNGDRLAGLKPKPLNLIRKRQIRKIVSW